MFRMSRLLPVFGIVAAMTLAACGTGGDGGSASDKKDITIALGTEPDSLDGQRSSDGNARIVIQNIAEALVRHDEKGDLEPVLANSLPEVSGDKSWKVELRPGVKFHNDEELDAELVVENLRRAKDPDAGSENLDIIGTIKNVKAVDDMTVEIETKNPDPLLPKRLAAMPIMAKEVLSGDTAKTDLIGAGPYKLEKWDRGNSIKLERFDDYWGDAPKIGEATFKFVPDSGSQEAGLRSGEIDLITNLSPDSTDGVPKVFSGDSGESPAMILNADEGVTADVRVRRALNYAIDQEVISDTLFGGHAEPQVCQMSNPQLDHYNADLEGYPYDVEKARDLIKKAGAEGKEIEVIGTSGRWLRDRETAEAVGDAWKEIGLKPNIQILEFNNYLDVLFDRSERPESIYDSAGDPMLSVQPALDAIYSSEGDQGANSDTELAGNIERAGQTVDESKRAQLLDSILKRGCDQALMAFLPSPENLYGGSKDLVWQPVPDAAVRIASMSWK